MREAPSLVAEVDLERNEGKEFKILD